MNLVQISTRGAMFALQYFSALPAIGLVVYGLALRFGSSPRRWQTRHTVAAVAMIGPYFAIVWSWLFADQFYRVRAESPERWRLEYVMPARSELVDVAEVSRVARIPGAKLTWRILIETHGGRRYESAQIGRASADRAVTELRAALPSSSR